MSIQSFQFVKSLLQSQQNSKSQCMGARGGLDFYVLYVLLFHMKDLFFFKVQKKEIPKEVEVSV